MDRRAEVAYNDRLFSGGFRRRLHLARFLWVAQKIKQLDIDTASVLELGCYDGKLVEFLPQKPSRYLGLDANWEKGLEVAADKWAGDPAMEFRHCRQPADMQLGNETFKCTFAMETLEHVPPDIVLPYLAELHKATDDYLFITVPNEIGLVFLAKHIAKRLAGGDYQKYSTSELLYTVLGLSERVQRNEHKGFNYHHLKQTVSTYFDILECSGHPLKPSLPAINFGIGMLCRPKVLT